MPLLPEAEQALVDLVHQRHKAAEHEHKQHRARWNRYYLLYRGYKATREVVKDARDRDVVSHYGREWGAQLHIPYTFRTIETIIPRMLAHRPRMLPLPRDEQAMGNVNNMRLIIERQQERCRYQLQLQDIAKDGLTYGLGVQKTGWRKEERNVHGIKPSINDPKRFVEESRRKLVYDDAFAEWVDPYNFFWDPAGHSIETCRYVIHRTWRDEAYVVKKVQDKTWRAFENDPTCAWNLEDLLSSSAVQKRDEVERERAAAEEVSPGGYTSDPHHEVWEYHDGEQVITLLDSQYPVQVGANPIPDGSLPFQVYRPTTVSGRMVGIGEVEPLEDLQAEMDTLRGQRRDAATMALGAGGFFDEQVVSREDIADSWGPNKWTPTNGNPRDAAFPRPVNDVPGSGYQEAREIASDIDMTSGISDMVAGGEGGNMTATGAQLVHQAASERIKNKTMLIGEQVIIPGGYQFVLLNQTKILEPREEPVMEGSTDEPAWRMVKVGPNELRGTMAITMGDGSTAAENVPQQRQDAQALMALQGNPMVNQQQLTLEILKRMGFREPEVLMAPQEEQIPASMVEQVISMFGIPPEAFTAAMDQIEAAQQQAEQGAAGPTPDPEPTDGQ